MAANRLFIYDKENNSAIMIATGTDSGWYGIIDNILFNQWLDENTEYNLSRIKETRYELKTEFNLPGNVKVI